MLREFLRSHLVWRLSGLTYPTAVLATHGSYASPEKYVADCKLQMALIHEYFEHDSVVLEFGCGLGGNLIALGDSIQSGIGVDINGLYIRWAKRLARRFSPTELNFFKLHGTLLPAFLPTVDVIFALGVFERLPKSIVSAYLFSLSSKLKPNGTLLVELLSERAHGTQMTRRLGDDAYVFWTPNEATSTFSNLGLLCKKSIPWGALAGPEAPPGVRGEQAGQETGRVTSVGDLYALCQATAKT